MSDLEITEGHVDFDAGVATPCQTYWKKIASKTPSPGPALLVIPGGPTFGHHYLLCLQDFARRGNHSSVIFYDHLGCGNSTSIPEKKNDSSFWNLELLRKELVNLTEHMLTDIAPEADGRYDVYGHSAGALLAALFAANDPPAGLRKLVLSNGMASLRLLNESVPEQLAKYPVEARRAIIEFEEHALGRRAECQISKEDYMAALLKYRDDHVMRMSGPMPPELLESYKSVHASRDAFRGFAGGDVQMIYGGSLEKEDVTPILRRINVPTLVLNGEYDKASESCSAPFRKLIPVTKSVILSGMSHFPFYEDQERYLGTIREFLES